MTNSNELELSGPLTVRNDVGSEPKDSQFSGPTVCGRRLSVSGRILRTASIYDEPWIEDPLSENPQEFIDEVGRANIRADLFTFAETLDYSHPRFPEYHVEWENAAVVPVTTFASWWEGVPQETRKNVRRSGRRGVTIKEAQLDRRLVEGIKCIYDETPFRQGRQFWHYGKDLDRIERENSSYMDRASIFGAYFQDELIGF